MRLTFRDSARAEALEAIAWVAVHSEASALDFTQALDRAVALLTEMPFMGTRITRAHRRVLVHRYPYQVVYRVEGDLIVVIAVAHTSRKPGYWRGRR